MLKWTGFFFARVFVIALALLVFAEPLVMAAPRVIRAADDAAYPPQIMLREDGKADGLEADLIRALERETGLQVEWQLGSWADAVLKLRNRQVEIIPGMNVTAERKREFLFTRPYFEDRVVLFVATDSFHIVGLDDLRDRRVGIQKGEVAGQLLRQQRPGLNYYEYDSQRELLQAVAERKIDAAAANYYAGKYWLRQADLEKQVKTSGESLFVNPFAIAVRADDPELMAQLDKALAKLEASGELQRIKDKWFGETATFWGLSRQQLINYAVAVLLLAGVLALAALLFIHWLRRKIVAATRIISDQNLELQAAYEQLTAQNEELIAQGEELMSSEAKSKALLQATPDMIVRLSREGIYREIYIPQGTEIFNLHSMRTGQSIYQSIPTDLADRFMQLIETALNQQTMQTIEYDLPINGEIAFRESRIIPMKKDEVMVIVRDLTEKRATTRALEEAHRRLQEQHEQLQAHNEELSLLYSKLSVSEAELRQKVTELEQSQQKLAASEERFRLALDAVNDVIYDWDLLSGRVQWSDRWEQRLGFSFGSEGITIANFNEVVHPADRELRFKALEEHLSGRAEYYTVEYRLKTKQGGYFWVLSRGKALLDAQQQPMRIVGSLTDITEMKQRETKIRQLAYSDALTGLANRTRFLEELQDQLQVAATASQSGCVLFVNIDNFKNINDSFGHSCGDDLLREVARRLSAVITGSNLLARLGGDEFVVLLKNERQAESFAETVLTTFSKPFEECGHKFLLSASIGISRYPENGLVAGDLLRCADTAMHAVKRTGKNGWKYYDNAMHETALTKIRMENHLRFALKNEEFSLHYQPIVDSSGLKVLGMEALLRWRNAELGMVSPADFIPLAEETGQIVSIGEWVLRSACMFGETMRQSGYPQLFVSVNISPRQLTRDDFVGQVRDALRDSGLAPSALELEITETSLVESFALCTRKLLELRELGVRVALDDFGTGYSSLTYLKRLPIQVVKIDKSFIDDATAEFGSVAILGTMIELAHELGLQVVAEGVESESQLKVLAERRCDMIQGYLISRPLPAAKLSSWLAQQEG